MSLSQIVHDYGSLCNTLISNDFAAHFVARKGWSHMLSTRWTSRIAALVAVAAMTIAQGAACGDDDGSSNQNNQSTDDSGVQPDGAAQPDGGQAGDQGIGSACECTDTECDQLGVPLPNGGTGTITGCDDVPTDWTGADRVCLRSYAGSLATKTYFANGYCGLMATTCTGAEMICNSAVFGDYAAMVACPAGTVMIQDTQEVSYSSTLTATIQTKLCAKPCVGAADCRTTETDPVWTDEATQYQCIDKAGVKFCYDPRNLGASYTATQY